MSKKEINNRDKNKRELEKILKIDKVCRIFAFILTALETVSIICLIIILIFNNKNHDLIYFLILNISIGLMILSIMGLEISKCKRKKEQLVGINEDEESAEEENKEDDKETPIIVPIVDEKDESEEAEESAEEENKEDDKEIPIIVPIVDEKDESEEAEESAEEENKEDDKETPIIVPIVDEKDESEEAEESAEEENKEEKVIPAALPVTEFDNDEDNYDDLEEIHVVHEVNVEEANELMSDTEATHFIHEKETFISDRTNRGIVNIKQLSRYFVDDEVVTLEGMKVRIPGFDKKLTYVKVLADGNLDKRLKVYADDFSIEAAKMILLTGGRVVRAKK